MFQVSDIDYLGNIIKSDEFDFSRSVHEAVCLSVKHFGFDDI